MNIECLQNVIGLSTKACECLDVVPEDKNISWSGLYIDNALYGLPLTSFKNCNHSETWSALLEARNCAIESFYTWLLMEQGSGNKFSDFIGLQNKCTSTSYNGEFTIAIDAKKYTLKNIKLTVCFDTTETIEIQYGNTIREISVIANVEKFIELDWQLAGVSQLIIRSNGRPKTYELNCGCSGVTHPRYIKDRYMSVKVYNNGNPIDRVPFYATFDVVCDNLGFMCDPAVWKDTDYGRVIATALAIQANICLYNIAANTNTVSQIIVIQGEALKEKVIWLQARFNEMLSIIQTILPQGCGDNNDCKVKLEHILC